MARAHGFLEEAVKEIIARPGQTANEIAKRLLEDGRAKSMAENPIGSLVATLHKHHAAKSISREWRKGQFRYYPAGALEDSETDSLLKFGDGEAVEEPVGWLPKDCLDFVDALLELSQFSNRQDAVIWLIRKGKESVRVS